MAYGYNGRECIVGSVKILLLGLQLLFGGSISFRVIACCFCLTTPASIYSFTLDLYQINTAASLAL